MFSIERGGLWLPPFQLPTASAPHLSQPSDRHPRMRPLLREARGDSGEAPRAGNPHRYTPAGPLPVTVAAGVGSSGAGRSDAAASAAAPAFTPLDWAAKLHRVRSAPTEQDKAQRLFDLIDVLLYEMVPMRGPRLIGNPRSPALAKTNEWHETPLHPALRQELFDHYRDVLQLAREIDAAQLPPRTADDLAGLELVLTLRTALAGHTEYLTPVSHMVDSWPIHQLRVVKDQIGLGFSSHEEVALFLDILSCWPNWIAQARRNMEDGLGQGVGAPRASIREACRVIENAGALQRSTLYEAASARLRALDLPAETIAQLDAEYWRIVDDVLIPGYQELHGFLQDYTDRTRAQDGLNAIPGGVRQYADMVRLLTCSTYELDEVQEMLRQEVRDAEAGVDAIQRELGIDASRLDFMTFMHDQARQRDGFATPQEVLACFESTVKAIQREAHRLVPVAGPLVVNVQQIPAGQPGQYVPPQAGSNVSTILVPVDYSNLAQYTRPYIAVFTTHELIGHGYFTLYQHQRGTRPSFAHRVALAGPRESFAMYVERLVDRLGFVEPAYRYQAAQNRLCTAVWADLTLRLHLGEIDLQESVVEHQDRAGSLPEKAHDDMLRSLVWGGQEQAFWLNAAVIDRAQREAQRRLGPAFDLLDFNRAVMDAGERPPHLIEQALGRWIERNAP